MALKSLFHELQEKNVAKRCHCNAGHLCILVICCVYRIRVLMETWKKETHPLEVFIYNIILSIVHS